MQINVVPPTYQQSRFADAYSALKVPVISDSAGFHGPYAYDAVQHFAVALHNMRQDCVPVSQIQTNHTLRMQYMRNVHSLNAAGQDKRGFDGASGYVEFPPLGPRGTNANANNRVLPTQYLVMNMQKTTYVQVGYIDASYVVIETSPILYPPGDGRNANPPVHYILGVMWTNLGDENSVKVPYAARLTASKINDPFSPEGGKFDTRNSLVVLPTSTIWDDCGQTDMHFTKVRAMLQRWPSTVAIIGPQCSSVALALSGSRDPNNPSDTLFPLQIPMISYGATANQLSCATTCRTCPPCPTDAPICSFLHPLSSEMYTSQHVGFRFLSCYLQIRILCAPSWPKKWKSLLFYLSLTLTGSQN